jgi:hypothetical protein
MAVSHWYKRSSSVIASAIQTGRDAGETNEQIRARADAAYPFGQRSCWPYKKWLQARADRFAQYGLLTAEELARYRAKQRPRRKPGQTEHVPAHDFDIARESGLIR